MEVGVPGSYTVTLTQTANSPRKEVATSFEWHIPWLGTHTSGSSNIEGYIKSVNDYYPFSFPPTTVNTCTIPILLGDFFNTTLTDDIEVVVYFDYKDAQGVTKHDKIPVKKTIKYNRVLEPTLSSVASIPKCCVKPFTVSADGKDANIFNWVVTNGTIQSGQGNNTVTIVPNISGNITITCTASRTTAINTYTRTSSKTITRYDPTISAIGDNFICKNENKTYCIKDFDKLCGVNNVSWSIPSSLTTVSVGNGCITVIPNQNVTDGTTGQLSATCSFTGGCIAISQNLAFTIFSNGTPPTPDGSVYALYGPGADCHGPYVVHFAPNNPYTNGITTINPRTFYLIYDPIHHPKPIRITVCYLNVCSGLSSCEYFWLQPPPPCPDDDFIVGGGNDQIGLGSYVSAEAVLDDDRQDFDYNTLNKGNVQNKSKLNIYPNPFKNVISMDFEVNCNGILKILDSNGHEISKIKIVNCSSQQINLDENLTDGIYYISLTSDNLNFTKAVFKN